MDRQKDIENLLESVRKFDEKHNEKLVIVFAVYDPKAKTLSRFARGTYTLCQKVMGEVLDLFKKDEAKYIKDNAN